MKNYIILDHSEIKRYWPNKKIIDLIFSCLNSEQLKTAAILGGAARYMLSPNINNLTQY